MVIHVHLRIALRFKVATATAGLICNFAKGSAIVVTDVTIGVATHIGKLSLSGIRKHERSADLVIGSVGNPLQFRPRIPAVVIKRDKHLLAGSNAVPQTLFHVAHAQQNDFTIVHLGQPKTDTPASLVKR